jgi:hypothetical protein
MTRDDLIIAAPWIAFAAGLCAIGIQLLRARRAAGPGPGKCRPGPVSSGASGPPQPGGGQETISSPEPREGQCSEKKTRARSP